MTGFGLQTGRQEPMDLPHQETEKKKKELIFLYTFF